MWLKVMRTGSGAASACSLPPARNWRRGLQLAGVTAPGDWAHRITVDSVGRVFLVELWNCRVEVFAASGAFLGRWGSCGFGDGQFDGAGGIAVDAAGKVYVADYNNNRVQVFQVRDLPARR